MAYKENMTQEEYNADMAAARKDYDTLKAENKQFKIKAHDEAVRGEFVKLNGHRYEDFKKIAGITPDTDIEEAKKTIKTFRKNDDYKFLFKADDTKPINGVDPNKASTGLNKTAVWVHREP